MTEDFWEATQKARELSKKKNEMACVYYQKGEYFASLKKDTKDSSIVMFVENFDITKQEVKEEVKEQSNGNLEDFLS